MKDRFTPRARAMWDRIPPEGRERLVANVWCTHCTAVTTIVDFSGSVKSGDLILQGTCQVCGKPVARLVEGA